MERPPPTNGEASAPSGSFNVMTSWVTSVKTQNPTPSTMHPSFTPTCNRRCSSLKKYILICNRYFHESYLNHTMCKVMELPMVLLIIPWEFSKKLNLFSSAQIVHSYTILPLPIYQNSTKFMGPHSWIGW